MTFMFSGVQRLGGSQVSSLYLDFLKCLSIVVYKFVDNRILTLKKLSYLISSSCKSQNKQRNPFLEVMRILEDEQHTVIGFGFLLKTIINLFVLPLIFHLH